MDETTQPPNSETAAHEALNKRRRSLYEKLMADPEFRELELEGRLAEVVADEERRVRTENDPVKLLAARDRWLLAIEMRDHYAEVLRKARLADQAAAEKAARKARGEPAEENE